MAAKKSSEQDLSKMTKKELLKKASAINVPGRSKMNKKQLITAIKKTKKKVEKHVAAEPDFEVISVAPIQTVRKVVEDMSEDREDFNDAITKLAKQIDRIAVTNLSLQAKMTDLLIKVTEMITNTESMIKLLQKASELDAEPAEIKADMEPVTNELKKLNMKMDELKIKTGDMTEYLRKVYTRQLLGRVMEKK